MKMFYLNAGDIYRKVTQPNALPEVHSTTLILTMRAMNLILQSPDGAMLQSTNQRGRNPHGNWWQTQEQILWNTQPDMRMLITTMSFECKQEVICIILLIISSSIITTLEASCIIFPKFWALVWLSTVSRRSEVFSRLHETGLLLFIYGWLLNTSYRAMCFLTSWQALCEDREQFFTHDDLATFEVMCCY